MLSRDGNRANDPLDDLPEGFKLRAVLFLLVEKAPRAHGVFFAGMSRPFWCKVSPMTLPAASR